MTSKTLPLSLLALTCMGSLACSGIDAYRGIERIGKFALENPIQAGEDKALSCLLGNFPYDAKVFISREPVDNLYQLRFFDDVADPYTAQFIAIDYRERGGDGELCPDIKGLVGSDIDLTLDGCARAWINVGTCSGLTSLKIIGKLNFTKFSVTRNDSVIGGITGEAVRVIQSESGGNIVETATHVADFTGIFQFSVAAGAVWNW